MLLLALAAVAADPGAWRSAVLAETHREADSDVYSLDTGEKIIVCRQSHWISDKPLDLEVGKPVQYSRSGRNITVRDSRGKPHKLAVESETAK